ncbi:transcriptional regulator [Erysipelotrichaceae bacterium]|nr:transcriptional regulator [Erysipelotrichaceae bacterium]
MNNQSRSSKSRNANLKKRKKYQKIFIITFSIFLLLAASTGAYSWSVYQTYLATAANVTENDIPAAEVIDDISIEPFSILFIGIGTNGNDGEASLADSINLLTINPQANYAEAIAIPRDSFLPFGEACDWGVGYYDKITHATSSSCLQTSLENVFDLKINYYVSADFNGFIKIIDALGGIEMEVPDLREGFENYAGDPSDGAFLSPSLKTGDQWCEHNSNRDPFAICFSHFGPQILDGEQALALARSRHYDGDWGRSLRQSELIKAIITKTSSPSIIASAPRLLAAVGDSIETNIPPEQFFDFANLGKDLFSQQSVDESNKFSIRTTQLAGVGGIYPGHRIQENLYFSLVPIASIEDIRYKIKRALSDGDAPLSIENFDFAIDSSQQSNPYTDSELLTRYDDVSDTNTIHKFS